MTVAPTGGSTYQLELGLGVPRLTIEPEWKAEPRLWGHSLHPMCSYLASFPAALSHAFIARYSRPGDVVRRSALRQLPVCPLDGQHLHRRRAAAAVRDAARPAAAR